MNGTSKYQKFEIARVHRSQLKNAPYNPRMISEAELKRLKKVIKSNGIVSTITWNEKTGNIVGGHQRVKCLDALEKTEDYYIDVAKINVSEKEEVHLNLMLNNASISGQFDTDAIKSITESFDIDFMSVGFTDLDMDLMFDGEFSKLTEDTEDVKDAKAKIDEIKKERESAKESFQEKNSAEFYFTVVCESEEEKKEFMQILKAQPYDKFIMGGQFRQAVEK